MFQVDRFVYTYVFLVLIRRMHFIYLRISLFVRNTFTHVGICEFSIYTLDTRFVTFINISLPSSPLVFKPLSISFTCVGDDSFHRFCYLLVGSVYTVIICLSILCHLFTMSVCNSVPLPTLFVVFFVT